MSNRKDLATIAILVVIFLGGIWISYQLNTDFGLLKVDTISIPAGELQLSGLLYIPSEAHPDNPRPAVVLTHGISSSKETVSGIALELARRGIVSLAFDLLGHGDSEGGLGMADPSMGMNAVVDYVGSLSYVDRGLVGVVGHSLGAGAARATAFTKDIAASAFIGGGTGGEHRQEGVLTQSSPRNLLIAVGRHDVLFDIDTLVEDLQPIFGTVTPVEPGITYGDLSSGQARKLVVTPTIHLLEPLDATIVSEVVSWFMGAFDSPSGRDLPSIKTTYIWRELAILLSLMACVGIVFPLSRIARNQIEHLQHSRPRDQYKILSGRKVLLLWGGLGVVSFLPFMGLGAMIPFPPQLFGSSMAWWLLSMGVIGALLRRIVASRSIQFDLKMRELISSSFKKNDVLIASGLVTPLYLIGVSVEELTSLNLRIYVPILPISRAIVFPSYVPFFLVFFFVEGLYLHALRKGGEQGYTDLFKVLAIKLIPYLAVLGIQYIPMYTLNLRLFPGLLGFFLEFIWAIVPLFAISTQGHG
jgi:dienelactone hydrolase